VGALIEKAFEGGRDSLGFMNVQIESLACIVSMIEGKIVFAP